MSNKNKSITTTLNFISGLSAFNLTKALPIDFFEATSPEHGKIAVRKSDVTFVGSSKNDHSWIFVRGQGKVELNETYDATLRKVK